MTIDLNKEFVWAEKYRPRTIEETILPEEMKNQFLKFITNEDSPNLLISGPTGTGKTTSALAMLEEMGHDYIVIDGSSDNGVDVMRHQISNYASSVSFSGKRKYVIIDEADYLSVNAQASFRSVSQAVSKNCGFIFICNHVNKLMDAVQGRFTHIVFNITNEQKPKVAMLFFKRVLNILDLENAEYDKRVVSEVISKFFPDYRRILNELQGFAAKGKIDAHVLTLIKDETMNAIFEHLKAKNFDGMLKWCSDNSDQDMTTIFTRLFKSHERVVSLPDFIVTLGEYQYKNSLVANRELNMAACLTEIMYNCEIK